MKRRLLAVGLGLALSIPIFAFPFDPKKHLENYDDYQSQPVRGKVMDQNNEPLFGVTVTAKGTKKSVVTSIDGTFNIDVPDGVKIIVITYIGLETQEINVSGKNDIAIRLRPSDASAMDVVVVGYGTQRKASITGSVSTVTGAVLTQRPVPNVGDMLQGRVTGLQVTQPSGEPGRDNPNFLIRGRGSFGGSTTPLVLIDGVTGSLNNLSPDDVESITVLKDASSASIYGARAANGVIIVTTKKGKNGQMNISYRVNVGNYRPTALPDFITNSAEYMDLYNQAATRTGAAFKYPQADIDAYRNATDRVKYPNFNTVDYYFKPATVVSHNLSISGGNEKSTYNLSFGYLNQDAMLPVYNFKKYNALFNYTSQVSKSITVNTIMNFTYKDRKEPPFTSENMALLVYASGPLYGPFLPDGSGRIVSRGYQNEGRNRNPQEAFAMGWQDTKEYNFNGQVSVDIKLFKGLTWSSKAAINYVDEYYKMYQHPYDAFLQNEMDPLTNDYKLSSFGPDLLGVTDQYSKTLNPTIYSTFNYATKIGDHHITALAGYEQLYYHFQSLRGRRINTVSTALTELTGYTSASEALYFSYPRLPALVGPSEWAMQSVFGRVNYDYKGKYFVEGDLRYDGTSKVSPAYRWGVFPSLSAGWLVSQEKFIQDKVSVISNLKLRASYGTLGNQDIGTYLYQDNLTISNIYYPFGNGTLQQGAVINAYKDQSLKWESTRVIDFGVDLDIKKGLFGVTFDWFNKTSFDILAAQPVPASLGLSQPTINSGKLQNVGVELELRHNNKIGQVTYGVFGQISTAKNKVLEITVPTFGTTIRQVGQPYDAHYLYVWDGIFQTADLTDPKVPKHALNPTPKAGDLKMKDLNGDGVVDANDRTVVKGAYPDYIFSFGFNVDYKGFSLNAFFQGVEGIANRVNNWGVDPFMQGTPPTTKWRNAWTPTNPTNTLPAIYTAGYAGVANYAGSTYYLMDASYLRMKSIVLSYAFPKAMLSRMKVKGLTVYVSADNLITWTKYEGSDPERSSSTGNFVQYPQAKILNAGLNIKF